MNIDGIKSSIGIITGNSNNSLADVEHLGDINAFSEILENFKSNQNSADIGVKYPEINVESPQSSYSSKPINNENSFGTFVKELINDVNDMQLDAGNKTDMFIKGEPIDIHDVMIAANKAKTSFQLLMELRNKGLDLYREVSRMQS